MFGLEKATEINKMFGVEKAKKSKQKSVKK